MQLANPKLRPLVIVGDGAFQMNGMEFSTMVRYGLNPIVIILNNQGYQTERLIHAGEFNDIANWNFETIPQLVGGGHGVRVQTEDELDRAMTEALASNVPTLIHVVLPKNDYTPTLKRMFAAFSEK